MRNALFVVGLLALAGCKKDGAPASPPTSTWPVALLAPAADGALHGKVVERIDAPNYTYLRLSSGQAEVWTAVPTTTVAVGTEVTVPQPQAMPGFESKTLNRKWDMIYFGSAAQTAAVGEAAPAPHPTPAAIPSELQNVKVEKATGAGAKTIAEAFAERTALKDQPVSVRGKVVKVTSGVLGKTWLHLRDGSGGDETKDNDLTVTTTAAVTTGDVVTVTGPLHLDVNLGGGYAYPRHHRRRGPSRSEVSLSCHAMQRARAFRRSVGPRGGSCRVIASVVGSLPERARS